MNRVGKNRTPAFRKYKINRIRFAVCSRTFIVILASFILFFYFSIIWGGFSVFLLLKSEDAIAFCINKYLIIWDQWDSKYGSYNASKMNRLTASLHREGLKCTTKLKWGFLFIYLLAVFPLLWPCDTLKNNS